MVVEIDEDEDSSNWIRSLEAAGVAAENTKGSSTSGNFNHPGRPGQVGGSGPSTASPYRWPDLPKDATLDDVDRAHAETGLPMPFLLNVSDIDTHQQPKLERAARGAHMSVEGYTAALDRGVRESLDKAQPWVRIGSVESMARLLDTGRFKSQFESGTSRGLLDPTRRAVAEEGLMGLPISLPPEQRPIYGYMAEDSKGQLGLPASRFASADINAPLDQVGDYGNVAVRLKDSVLERTTVTANDSLGMLPSVGYVNTSKVNQGLPMPYDQADHRIIDTAYQMPSPGLRGTEGRGWSLVSVDRNPVYVEAQYQGGLKISDIAEVVLPWRFNPETYTAWSEAVSDDPIIARLKEAGIRVSFGHEPDHVRS